MSFSAFSDLPDEARLWVFAFAKPLGPDDRKTIERQLGAFLPHWASHQLPVEGAFAFLHDRFVLVAGHCPGGLSGCSMDSCMANFKQLKLAHNLDALNGALVHYRSRSGEIESVDRATFQKRLDSGQISAESPVFDTTLQTLGQLRSGALETPLESAWHARAFRIPVS